MTKEERIARLAAYLHFVPVRQAVFARLRRPAPAVAAGNDLGVAAIGFRQVAEDIGDAQVVQRDCSVHFGEVRIGAVLMPVYRSPGLCLLVVRVGVTHAQVRDEKLNVVAEDIDDQGEYGRLVNQRSELGMARTIQW